jgi:hypothetical protein
MNETIKMHISWDRDESKWKRVLEKDEERELKNK